MTKAHVALLIVILIISIAVVRVTNTDVGAVLQNASDSIAEMWRDKPPPKPNFSNKLKNKKADERKDLLNTGRSQENLNNKYNNIP